MDFLYIWESMNKSDYGFGHDIQHLNHMHLGMDQRIFYSHMLYQRNIQS